MYLSGKEIIAASLRGVTYEAPKAVVIGTLACSLMGTLMGLVVLLDLNKLYTDFKLMKGNVESLMRYRSVTAPAAFRMSQSLQHDGIQSTAWWDTLTRWH